MAGLLKFSEMVAIERQQAARYRELGRSNVAAQIDARCDVAEKWLKENKLWSRKSARGYSIHPIPKVTLDDLIRNGMTQHDAMSVLR